MNTQNSETIAFFHNSQDTYFGDSIITPCQKIEPCRDSLTMQFLRSRKLRRRIFTDWTRGEYTVNYFDIVFDKSFEDRTVVYGIAIISFGGVLLPREIRFKSHHHG